MFFEMTCSQDNSRALRLWLTTTIVAFCVCRLTGATQDTKPNIVILFADNLGYNDVGIFGSPAAKTPNIDKLGFDGLKLNNWNSAAHLCSASRAALLTGKLPVRTGVYPAVFKPGAVYGLLPNETTLAEYLKEEGYATSIVGKWHLGHRDPYLPTNQGFDTWTGIPYHMSGGSVDHHVCDYDSNKTMWLPLFEGTTIVEQPVHLQHLAQRYVTRSTDFIRNNSQSNKPFFLYMAFSHVHQLCAPAFGSEQDQCQWASPSFSKDSPRATFVDAVQEMDWIAGEILNALEKENVSNNTLVIFTSDNGPWIAEEMCSGSKGPFEGRWLQELVSPNCTACPHDYIADPEPQRPRRCVSAVGQEVDGIHCGADTGLGGMWEANLRMPALVKWPGRIAAGTETMEMVSTLDVLPTILTLLHRPIPQGLDGQDISNILLGRKYTDNNETRTLFFWRDGFQQGPLPVPYGRFDVVAVKHGNLKAWFWTKSAHYNPDVEQFHDPPLLFNVIVDPAEAFPLDPNDYADEVQLISKLVKQHKESVDWTYPLALATDSKYIPCVDKKNSCRTTSAVEIDALAQ